MNQPRPTVRRGSRGELIEELHQLLAAAGLPLQGDPAAVFGPATEETVRAFQRGRNLQVDGVCGPDTWSQLFEPRHQLGDRLLAMRRPMLRGSDVATLQQQLNGLGFDPGRVDAIFGPDTQRALIEFQRDAGISSDGICGPNTTLALSRMGHLADGTITNVREREHWEATPRKFAGRRIYICCREAMKPLTELVAARLSELGALTSCRVDLTIDADAAALAVAFDADICILLQPIVDDGWRAAYYGSGRYRSFRGAAIAQSIASELKAMPGPSGVAALATGFLRETPMPAVVLQLDRNIATEEMVQRVAEGIKAGFEQPPEMQSA